MYPKNRLYLLPTLLLCLLTTLGRAQTTSILLPEPDLEILRTEDKGLGDFRFSAPLSLDLAPAAAPEDYTNEEGNVHLWSRSFTVPAAHGLALFFKAVQLPEGAEVIVDNGTREKRFRQADVTTDGQLFSGFLSGESLTLTYRGPLPETPPFRLWRIDHVYRPELWDGGIEKGFGDANDCHVNANCADGDGWDDEKSGTARITVVVAEGVGFCSGNLVNNTARDGRPFLLSGYHCFDGFTPIWSLWTTDFGYAFSGCDDETTEPVPANTYTGVGFRAGRFETDFLLLEILDPDFAAEDHYFAGWDRSPGDVTGTVRHFHHPQGDVQKLGITNTDGLEIRNNPINWNSGRTTPAEHHFEGYSIIGTFEPGSSGSAFFDENRRIRGNLNGGNPSCTPGETESFVGRFHLAWDQGDTTSTRLREWLDPLGTGVMTLDGENLITRRFVSGQVLRQGGLPAVGATITFSSAAGTVNYVTDENGRYRGERPPLDELFGISGTYLPDGPPTQQVNVGDIINIRRHILGFDTLTDVRMLAGDVNNSGTIRVSDITLITTVILDIGTWGDRPNWLVVPLGRPLDPLPQDPEAPVGIQLNSAAIHDFAVDFFVVKTGDASGD